MGERIRKDQLTSGQKKALLHILRHKNVLITGGAGSGKSAVIELAVQALEEEGRTVAVCAPTAKAALGIGGTTVHFLFGLPAEPCVRTGNNGVFLYEKASPQLKAADSVVIDECSMLRVDFMDTIFRSIRKAEQETGKRIQLILVGDFYQIPPVLPEKDRSILESFYGTGLGQGYAFKGLYWKEFGFCPVILHEAMRQKDLPFVECLNRIRIGDPSGLEYLNRNVAIGTPRSGAVSLFARNCDVNRTNKTELDKLDKVSQVYQTRISYEDGYDISSIDDQVLREIPGYLELKDGAQVMFTSNDYPGNRAARSVYSKAEGPLYVNGLTGHVLEAGKDGSVIVYTDFGKVIEVGPVPHPVYSYTVQGDRLVKVKVATWYQIPLCLAYAMTFHRCQGQTLNAVHVDPSTFGPGQFYVGASRCTSLEGLSLTRPVTPADLVMDPDVAGFYSSLEKGGGIPGAGREKKDCLIWIPRPLAGHVQKEIALGRPISLTVPPTPSEGRVHVRVPSSLRSHIVQEASEWKKKAGIGPGRKKKEEKGKQS